jgi:hypothetical protein
MQEATNGANIQDNWCQVPRQAPLPQGWQPRSGCAAETPKPLQFGALSTLPRLEHMQLSQCVPSTVIRTLMCGYLINLLLHCNQSLSGLRQWKGRTQKVQDRIVCLE